MPPSSIPDHQLRPFRFADHREEVIALRQHVWQQCDPAHIPFVFANGFTDAVDEMAHHYGLFGPDGAMAAAARFTVHCDWDTMPDTDLMATTDGVAMEFPSASLNRLVVMPHLQGLGAARLLDEVRTAQAARLGCPSVCLATYGVRSLSLLRQGYVQYDVLTISTAFASVMKDVRPPAFYVKRLSGAAGHEPPSPSVPSS